MRSSLLLLFVLLIGCTKNQPRTDNLLGYLPQQPSLIIKLNHLANLRTELNNNRFLQALEPTATFSTIAQKLDVINEIDPASEALLGVYEEGKNMFEFVLVAKNLNGLSGAIDSDRYVVEPFLYENVSAQKILEGDTSFFLWKHHDIYLFTSSQLLLENAIRTNLPRAVAPALEQLYATSDATKTSTLLFNLEKVALLTNAVLDGKRDINVDHFAEWGTLDFSNKKNNLNLSGVGIANDSTKNFLNLFKGTLPSVESVAAVAPGTSEAMISFRFGDFSTFARNQKQYLDIVKEPDTLLNTIEEVGIIYQGAKKSVVLGSFGPSNLTDYLIGISIKATDYQGYEIKELQKAGFLEEQLHPLIGRFKSNFWALIENYFIFTEDQELLQTIIANKNSATTFNNSNAYLGARASLPNESSIFFITKKGGVDDYLNRFLSQEIANDLKKASLGAFSLAAQVSVDGPIFHTHLIVDKINKKTEGRRVSPLLNVQLDNDIAFTPQFVKNHRNGRFEIVMQDSENQLYLIDGQGKVLWKKQLEGPIQGKIHQVDLYKNGKLQLAFCTNNRFMVLDRNGEPTKDIDIKYEGGNLNGLAVFDYENNRNYRFVVTQGRKLFMYDGDGKKVDGFTFGQAESPILNTPKHFRINKKDYLVFQLENGKLAIRHRAGGNRITVNRTIDFSGNEVFLYKNKFSVTDKKGILHQVDTKGRLAATNFALGPSHGMYATSKTLAFMDDNTISIKGKKVELEIGVYTQPKIFYWYDKIYVAVTDIQNKKVHLFDSQANYIPNFPVHGSSMIDLIDMDGDKKLELVVKDQENSMLLYGIN